ncbi:hypothetical protein CTheo_7837 [Ceratobasidium theobromae]|uniref:Uncharacterized protein n=1 Tax=Ceratobasidium theobromae TaxID=1582974 RepID=A0A5N5QAF9_9AGAM|nr:hypothetical protein CTheo_7837 [Ceratobasidium theobromae]
MTTTVIAGPFKVHSHSVLAVAISPDRARTVSGSDDCTIVVWGMITGDVIAGPFQGHTSSVRSVAFSPDGTCVVSGSDDWAICVWDVRTMRRAACSGPYASSGHTGSVHLVAFSQDGTRIFSSSDSMIFCVWDALSLEIIAGPFREVGNVVTSAAFSPTGAHIISGSAHSVFHVYAWDSMEFNKLTGLFVGDVEEWLHSIALSPDGTHIASSTASSDGVICIWDPHTRSSPQDLGSSSHLLISPGILGKWRVNEDGWVIAGGGRLLIWVPMHLWHTVLWPGNILAISSAGSLQLPIDDLLDGNPWCRLCWYYHALRV